MTAGEKFPNNLRRAGPPVGNTAVDPARHLPMSVLAALTRLDDATDGQLLGRFVQSRDADAFTALVRRLGPTVLAVCPDAHLAEDAFQAAFLVLARKADTVRPREQVAVWLHGVAYRTASKARVMLANRRRREATSPALPEAPAPDIAFPDEELRMLDAAIAALPNSLRAAVVLCELEGRSRKDAAKQLGIPEGTLSSRLADARKRLGERLRPTVAATVTAALAANTAEAVVSGSTSETVRTLARGVMSMMLLNKLKLSAIVAVLLTATVLVVPLFTPAHSAPVPKSLKEPVGGIGVTKGGVLYLLKPDGTTTHQFDVEEKWKLEWLEGPCRVCPSPSGFPVAVLVPRSDGAKKEDGADPRYELRMIRSATDTKGEVIDLSQHLGGGTLTGRLVWSRSGKQFYVEFTRPEIDGRDLTDRIGKIRVKPQDEAAELERLRAPYLAIEAATGKVTRPPIPTGYTGLLGEVVGGGWVMYNRQAPSQGDGHDLARVSADGKTHTELKPLPAEVWAPHFDLSPDGRTILGMRTTNGTDELLTFDSKTGGITPIRVKGLDGVPVAIRHLRWSPDGKRVGFIYQRKVQPARETDAVLHVCDRDGANGMDIFTWRMKGESYGEVWDALFEWN